MEQSPELSETDSKVAQQINEAIQNGGSAEDVIKAGLGGLSPQEAEKLQEEATKLFNGLLGTE